MQDVTPQSVGVPHPVRRARETKRLSPEGLAFKAGLSLKTIERIERGETSPHRSTRAAIARALEVDEDALFPVTEAAAA